MKFKNNFFWDPLVENPISEMIFVNRNQSELQIGADVTHYEFKKKTFFEIL